MQSRNEIPVFDAEHQSFVEAYQAPDHPAHPIIIFSFVDIGEDTTPDPTDQMDVTLQLGCQAPATQWQQALNVTNQLHELLRTAAVHRIFRQVKIVPHGITRASDRTAFEYINALRNYGFDCSFLITGVGDVYQKEQIDTKIDFTDINSVTAQNTSDKKAIDASRNKEE